MCDNENDVVRKHKEHAKNFCSVEPSKNRSRLAGLKKLLVLWGADTEKADLFDGYNMNKRNNMKMRGRE